MIPRTYFTSAQESHEHSLLTLNALYEYDDFMESVGTMGDLGCGQGLDLEWWATRTTRDEQKRPLNINCVGVDLAPSLSMASKYPNIQYQCQDFEKIQLLNKRKFDVLWCHDSFQYVINPLATLALWHGIMARDGMLILTVPQTTNMEYRVQAFDQRSHCYFNWTLVSVIHALAVSGFDCRGGFFYKSLTDPWIHAVVYRSEAGPQDPRDTSWYQLADLDLLPQSAMDSINKHGYLRQRDLLLPWLDRSLRSYQDY